jgi:hypothetical protein
MELIKKALPASRLSSLAVYFFLFVNFSFRERRAGWGVVE